MRLKVFAVAAAIFLVACSKQPEVIYVSAVTIGQNSAEMTEGETVQLKATLTPSNATNKDITWSSSNQSVASVSSTGLVTAIKEGSATITANASGITATCQITVVPLTFAISIADAANEYRYENSKDGCKVNDNGMQNLSTTGVFDLSSILLESIQNGTYTMNAGQVKELLFKNTIIIMSELPTLEAFEAGDLYRFDFDFEYGHGYGESNHATGVMDNILAVAGPVLRKLGKPVYSPSYTDSNLQYRCLSKYASMHPELYFLSTDSAPTVSRSVNSDGSLRWIDGPVDDDNESIEAHFLKWEYDNLQEALKNPNYFFSFGAFGNNYQSFKVDGSDGWWVLTLQECKDGKLGLYNIWTLGFDGVMGSDNNGTSHCKTYDFIDSMLTASSCYPTEAGWGSDRLWQETSNLWSTDDEATSWASPTACAKAYLMTCANMLVDSSITRDENRALIRGNTLDGAVLLNKNYLFTPKRMNPGGVISQFFSTLPESISISSSILAPIEHGVFLNSIVLGPGVVDENGIEVTQENYHKMLGKKLFIDPSKLYKYGHTVGDTIEYTEHLACDSLGTGAHDNATETYKSITSKTFSVLVL